MWIRGYYVPITFDEAATFFHFVHRGDFWFFSSLPDANNHFINTLLTYISYQSFGPEKIFLRLPNLISILVYLYYLYRCSKLIVNTPLRWIFILSLMFAHFFVEFFALSRGYGLSMAFLFGAFYHLMKFSEDKQTKNLILVSFFLILAELSNLSILVMAIAIIGYQTWVIITSKPSYKNAAKQYGLLIITQILPLLFASYYMFYLNEKGSLYYGDSSGFWNLTIQSLILFITGTKSIYYSISVVVLFVFLIFTIAFSIKISGLKVFVDSRLTLSILLFATMIGVVILSAMFGINHPEDRVAMYFIPLFLGALVMSADYLYEKTGVLVYTLPVVLLLFFPFHFIFSMNLSYVNGYKTEVLPEKFYSTILADEDYQSEIPPTIGGYRMRTFCWAYINHIEGGSQNLIDHVSYPENLSDFQIVDIEENPEWLEYYNVIDTEPVLGRSLLKRKVQPTYQFIEEQTIISKADISNEYFRLATWKSNSIDGNTCYVTANINISCSTSPFHAWFVLQLVDIAGKNISYKYVPFDWLKTNWGIGDTEFKHSIIIDKIPENLSEIKVYIWNLDKVNYTIERSSISLSLIN